MKKNQIFLNVLRFTQTICLIFLIALPCLTGCGKDDSEDSQGTVQEIIEPDGSAGVRYRLAKLNSFESCNDLVEKLKENAISDMEERLNENLESALQYGWSCYPILYEDGAKDTAVYAPTADGGNSTPQSESAQTYSETNNQVVGVDEADFIKNDGQYIYILADDKLKIIKAWPPENAHIISEVPIEGTPKKLFVTKDKALIYSSLDHIGYNLDESPYPMGRMFYNYDNDCTYGYNCDFTGDNRKSKITMFDITDRSNPSLVREIKFSGSYINSRRIDTAVHTVLFFPEVNIPGIRYWPEIAKDCWDTKKKYTNEEIINAFETLKEKNQTLIEDTELADWLPSIEDTRYLSDGTISTNPSFDCQSFMASDTFHGLSYLTLMSLDMDTLDDITQSTVIGQAGAVYASSSSLYVCARKRYRMGSPWFYKADQEIHEAGIVHKFHLKNDPAGCEYAASGVVKGRVLNQFSMDEFEDHLRIATTTGHSPNPDAHNTLSILKEVETEMMLTGQVDKIAPSEDIRSVRFNGPKAFVVTFKKTDPLYAFDLSDPTHPKIEGELKIPGYSTYMHLMDENHLLTIGYDSDDQGNFAWFQGIMLQIFDVSNMSNPRLKFKEIIGTRGSSSEAATNHLAFNYFPPKDLLALPMTICEDGYGGGSYGTEMTFSGLIIYETTVGNGFSEKGRVSHMDSNSANDNCYNWWTNANTVVKRSIFMDDYVFSIAEDLIKINTLDNLGNDIRVIKLVEP